MSIEDLIKLEIENTNKALEILKANLSNCDKREKSPKKCPNCKTMNYHYYPKNGVWCCALC